MGALSFTNALCWCVPNRKKAEAFASAITPRLLRYLNWKYAVCWIPSPRFTLKDRHDPWGGCGFQLY